MSYTPIIKCDAVYKIFGANAKKMLQESNGNVDAKTFQDAGCIVGVNNASFEVAKGEMLVVMGLSGSGKSTLLRCISRLTDATAGKIFIEGQDLLALKNKELIELRRNKMGMVFQSFALLPHKTVLENNAFPLQIKGIKTEDSISKAMDMVKLVGLDGRENYFPRELSGGQQQRVALARALVFEPRLVLMDEPLGALDKKLREQMQYEIKHIHEQIGITVVYVTHDQNEALTMSNRIAVFNDGKIQQISSPDIIYEKPENAFVAQFIGENNQIKGKVKSINGDMCVVETNKGEQIKSLKINVNVVGDASTVSLRPERVEINSSDSSFENSFDATVKELIYLGDHIRTRVEVCGNDQFIVKVPNSYKGANLKEGTSVKLSWKASDSRALDLR